MTTMSLMYSDFQERQRRGIVIFSEALLQQKEEVWQSNYLKL